MLTLVLLLAASTSAQTLSPSVLHAKRSHLPAGWSRVRRHAQDAVLPLRFGLTQSNVEMSTLERLLNDVSHPESVNYGKHWTPERVAEHFAPTEEAVHAVTSWIVGSGLPQERVRVSKTKGWVMVNASVAETEKLLNTQYHVYKHKSGKEHVACEAYHLPAHIVPHVALVTPSIDFNAMLAKRASDPTHKLGQPGAGVSLKVGSQISSTMNSDDLDNCDVTITPACVRALYDFRYSPVAAHKNSLGIAEYTPQAYRAADLDLFAKNFTSLGGESLVGARPVLQSIQGGVVQHINVSFEFNVESNFDLAYAMNLVTGKQHVTLYQVGDFEIGGSFNNFLDALDGSYCTFEGGDDPTTDSIYPDPLPGGYKAHDCGTVKPAYVISSSYADNEADLSPAYAIRQCAEYAKLGLMGVTVLYSSGDNGVAGNDALCLNPDGSQTEDGQRFNPLFPGTCAFVTGVGGTQINPGSKVTDPESAAELSSGGFSNYFPIPDYQKSAVAGYLKANPPPFPSAVYNATSRAFPDISSNAVNFTTTAEGIFFPVSGTSASSPVVAAMLSMINDARLAVGKGPIGFINPTIYSAAFKGAFNDITDGSNPGCGTPGFAAAKGYDPVTGLGTPNFPKLLKLWLALP
ncbi:peptidase S8/S53 domain-containing protein [Mycena metata]|uniref:tripeptidyl-peptidase II n=1 Tax=Mycena metata TaxID=1033252 RepID=A0AAD7P267_9AGAR|nr:peptidase S8/S53 domain-containing protein [Mycena metata]